MSTIKVEGWFIENVEHKKSGVKNKITAEFPEHMILYELYESGTTVDGQKQKHEYTSTIFFHPDEVKEGVIPFGFRVVTHIGRTF